MCLSDLKFVPYIRSRSLPIAITTNYTELLPRNHLRVGLFVPSVNNMIGRMSPLVAPVNTAQGFSFSNDQEIHDGRHIRWEEWGDLVQANWFFTLSIATTVTIFESLVPSDVMEEIRKLRLTPDFQKIPEVNPSPLHGSAHSASVLDI